MPAICATRAARRLLAPGAAESLTFTSRRVTAVRVESGARLVMVLRVSKRPDREINYGIGQGRERRVDRGGTRAREAEPAARQLPRPAVTE